MISIKMVMLCSGKSVRSVITQTREVLSAPEEEFQKRLRVDQRSFKRISPVNYYICFLRILHAFPFQRNTQERLDIQGVTLCTYNVFQPQCEVLLKEVPLFHARTGLVALCIGYLDHRTYHTFKKISEDIRNRWCMSSPFAMLKA